jgi:hypothetical protein
VGSAPTVLTDTEVSAPLPPEAVLCARAVRECEAVLGLDEEPHAARMSAAKQSPGSGSNVRDTGTQVSHISAKARLRAD